MGVDGTADEHEKYDRLASDRTQDDSVVFEGHGRCSEQTKERRIRTLIRGNWERIFHTISDF